MDLDDDNGITEIKVLSLSPSGEFAKVERVADPKEPLWLDIDDTDILEQIN